MEQWLSFVVTQFLGSPQKKRKKRKYKKKTNYSKKTKKYISGKRIPECLENSQRLVEEDKKIQRLKLNNIFLTDEGSIGKKI
jgi:tyrosine-protein phosphatase YwqE